MDLENFVLGTIQFSSILSFFQFFIYTDLLANEKLYPSSSLYQNVTHPTT